VTVLASGWWSHHGAHTLLLVGPAIVLTLVALGTDARAWLHKHGRRPPPPVTLIAAGFSVGAGVVHAAVAPEHFHEGLMYGEFFAVAAAAQLAWAGLAIVRPRSWVFATGLAGNLGIVILWAITRTIGVPVGPMAGEIEAVGALDLAASALEAVIVICCARTLMPALSDRGVTYPTGEAGRSRTSSATSSHPS
jgi:hypothetical protein